MEPVDELLYGPLLEIGLEELDDVEFELLVIDFGDEGVV
jgi:hypothetical protein